MFPSISEYSSYVLLSYSSIHYRHNGGDARKAHVCEASSSIHYRHNGGDARKTSIKFHPFLPQWRRCQKGTCQIMVSLDILCVSIDLRVYFLCPVIIQFHPLLPQWRRCQKGTREASSSIHYHHNGGDAKKAHVGRSNYGESRYFVCFHRSQSILLMSCYHIVPSITATMEEMPERHTYVKHPVPSITATMEEMPERHTYVKHPVPSTTATMEEMPERHT